MILINTATAIATTMMDILIAILNLGKVQSLTTHMMVKLKTNHDHLALEAAATTPI